MATNAAITIRQTLRLTISYRLCVTSSTRSFSSAAAQTQTLQPLPPPTDTPRTSITPKSTSLTSIATTSSLIEKLPRSAVTQNVPTTHPDYSPKLTYSQLQYLESGTYDIAVHDGNGQLLLKNGSVLPEFGKNGMKNLTESDMFEWIKDTEHLYRELYRDLMKVDPDLIIRDEEEHLLKFPFDSNTFFEETQLSRQDIKSWNLLLRVQTYHSHKKWLESTTDGRANRKKAFLSILETFREIQTMAGSEGDIDQNGGNEVNPLILNIDTYDAMLRAMAVHKEPTQCIELLREMGNLGVNPSQQSYVHLIKSFVARKQVREAHDIMRYLKANSEATGHRIELEVYNQVIYGYLKQRRRHEAMAVFDGMMQIDGEHPNTKTYTIMMEYYRQSRNVNGAIDLLREMEDRGFKPNQMTYNQAINAAAYGDVEDKAFKKMFELFDEMVISKEIPPTHHTFGALITGCGHIADIETATKCLHLMDKMGIARTELVYEKYLRAIANTVRQRRNYIQIGSTRNLKTNDLIRLGEGMVKQMQNDQVLKDRVGIEVVNALLSIYTSSQTVNRAMLFWKSMALRFENVEPNRDTLRLLWKATMRSRRYKEAQIVFNEFKRHELDNRKGFGVVKADMYREMVRLAAYWKDQEGVVRYLRMMDERGLHVRDRDKAYLAMVSGTKAEQLEARRRFWKESIKRRKDVAIREKARKHGKEGLSFRRWKGEARWAAEKAAGLRNNQPPRSVGKIYWNCDRSLGQLDDPW